VDEGVPNLAVVLTQVLEHLRAAQITPAAITLVCPTSSSSQAWVDDLPDAFQDVRIEIHQGSDRKKLAYLATTRQGRRVYLNRTAVDADQLILVSRRRYDPVVGVRGAETDLYPFLSDDATREEMGTKLSHKPPGKAPWPIRQEAREVAWLLGAPFLVQVIEGSGSEILHVVAGPVESSDAGQALLDARWRVEVDRAADLALGSIVTGDRPTIFAEIAQAFWTLTRVVKPGGRIALLTDAAPPLDRVVELMRTWEDPVQAQKLLLKEKPADLIAGLQWTSAAETAKLYLLSGIAGEAVEEMFATPLESAGQAQRLLGDGSCALIPDAHKTLAIL
jgi:nickel-dependent lactate racemase